MPEKSYGPLNESSRRMLLGLDIAGLWYHPRLIQGLENLEKAMNTPVVFASTHLTPADIIVSAGILAPRINIGISHISALLEHPIKQWIFKAQREFLGPENFFPIDYSINPRTGDWQSSRLNLDNFKPMVEAMRNGKCMLIAAHNPTKANALNILPEKGRLGALIVAHKAKAPIIPIAVYRPQNRKIDFKDLQTIADHALPGPKFEVKIGEPISFEKVDVDRLSRENWQVLKSQSNTLMRTLASMLPLQNRGIWE